MDQDRKAYETNRGFTSHKFVQTSVHPKSEHNLRRGTRFLMRMEIRGWYLRL